MLVFFVFVWVAAWCTIVILIGTQNGDDEYSRRDFLSFLIDDRIHKYINSIGEKKIKQTNTVRWKRIV